MGDMVHHIEIRLTEPPARREDRSLLFPVPPDFLHQRLVAIDLPPGWRATPVFALEDSQKALLIETSSASDLPIGVTVATGDSLAMDARLPPANSAMSVPSNLRQGIELIVAECDDLEHRAQHIVDYIASRFRYGSKANREVFSQASCSLQTGNCIDIHSALVAALLAARIEAVYCAGYFFEGAARKPADGMHCWVVSMGEIGPQVWDVAQHLKAGLDIVQANHDAISGVRIAMSVGKNLAFDLPGGRAVVEHLARPRWVRPSSQPEAEIVARLVESRPG